MIFYLVTVLAYINYAASRDVGKMIKATPSISNSLVNLGKMDISFYIGKPSDLPSGKADFINVLPNVQIPKPQIAIEPCPCTEFRGSMDHMFPRPSDIINKILMSKDLFKNPSSSYCCDSHEQIHEDTFVFDLTPNDFQRGQMKLPTLPLERMMKPQMRPKALEIFLFPKRKDLANFNFTKQSLSKDPRQKQEIQKVGKDATYIHGINEGTSVKKDLALMEKNTEAKKEEDKPASQNKV